MPSNQRIVCYADLLSRGQRHCSWIAMAVLFLIGSLYFSWPRLAGTRADEPPSQNPSDKELDGREVLQQIADAIRNNYAPLKSVQGTFEELVVTPTSPKIEADTNLPPQGNNFVLKLEAMPQAVIFRNEFVLTDKCLRNDQTRRLDNRWEPEETVTRRGEIWTTLTPKWPGTNHPRVLTLRTDQMGGHGPYDPRNFGWTNDRYELIDTLQRSKVVEILSRQPVLKLRTEIVSAPAMGSPKGQQFIFVFDPAKNFLPTSVKLLRQDGTTNDVTEFIYEAVIPGKSWFIREMARKFFWKGTTDLDSNPWDQMMIIRLVGDLKINSEINDATFNLKLPADADVADITKRK